ncbi:MAG: TIGR01906 family membrane protein [Clostridia bacterium]|nr:TIGR01906 family membrane protein [Clostridia bacterium]
MELLKRNRVLREALKVLTALAFVFLFISGAVFAVLAFRPLYYSDVDRLNIPQSSGLDRETVILNYDALIDYNLPLSDGELVFPSLAMSDHGRQHFAEVKDIFDAFKILFLILLPFCIAAAILFGRLKDRGYLLYTAIACVALPALAGGTVALCWDRLFVAFHKLFFNNDYWIFDPRYDPVITILPDTFFMHCAVGIVLIVLLCGGICAGIWIGGRMKTKKKAGQTQTV